MSAVIDTLPLTEARLTKELANPMLRIFVASIGLVGYVLARSMTVAVEFPPVLFWGVILGAGGSVVLTIVYFLRSKKYEMSAVARFLGIVAVVTFAIVFGLTWLLSAPR